MTKREKLIERFRTNPRNVRYEELENLLLHLGFEKRNTGSSHFPFKHPDYPALRITIPFKKPFLKPIYVEQVLALLDEYHVLEDLLD